MSLSRTPDYDLPIRVLDPRPPDSPSRSEETLADKVFEWLTEQIVSGHLRPGQWVSENEVAAQLGVSRSPVREALRAFARDGLVEVRRRRGTIIAELDAGEADDLYRTRELIEPEMARLAVEHMTEDDLKRAAAIAAEMRAAVGDPSTFYDAVLRFWQLLMDLCPSRNIRDIVAILWRRSIRFRGIVLRVPGGQKNAAIFAERFVKFARKRDADGAAAAMADVHAELRRLLREEVFLDLGDGQIARPLARGVGQRVET
jgi:DNA-binding GntR family transcriptional regulator